MFCMNCGTEIPQDATACPACGAALYVAPKKDDDSAAEVVVETSKVENASADVAEEAKPEEAVVEVRTEAPAAAAVEPVAEAEVPVASVVEPVAAPEEPAAQPTASQYAAPESAANAYQPSYARANPFQEQPPAAPSVPVQSQPVPVPPVPPVNSSAKTKAIVCLVIGIVAIVLCWVPFLNILAGIASIVGTVLSFQAMKALPRGVDGRGLAIAAFACCISGIVLNLALASCYGCIAVLADMSYTYY